ncbi:MAG: hypothetical protein EXR59_03675 [Dehalococcoidia bacterium]|nr:hypothetical protein [Dehalococcoidia bacterium]
MDDTQSPGAKKWAPAHENYTLKDEGRRTRFILEMDIAEEQEQEFKNLWQKALQKLKEISEKHAA